jgi:uncharacterized 2Fe-2S/4Fe-4S cluster protein (DUF4445 family)
MGKCVNHPNRETNLLCMKHNVFMCDECVHCRDPEIYCKFRSSCPIWFFAKRQKKKERDRAEAEAQRSVRICFLPDRQEAKVPSGSLLLDVARKAGVHLNASCNGKGSCGKCRLVVTEGRVDAEASPHFTPEEVDKGYVLACQSRVTEDATVRIPEEALQRKLRVAGMGQAVSEQLQSLVGEIDPILKEYPLELAPPTMEDAVSDLDRLNRGLKKAGCDVEQLSVGIHVMRQLADTIRRDDWQVTVSVVRRKCLNEILDVRPGNGADTSLGLAIDVGTTTVVVYLVRMTDGHVLAAATGHNRQAACGDDVINRIVCSEKDGVKKLSTMVLATINNLISEALDAAGQKKTDIRNIVVSGNTTMIHLLLRIEPRHIRREPYIPTVSEFPVLKASEVGIRAHPVAATWFLPGPASYVGGDIVSGVLYTGLHREDPLTLFIDVGTNGEIVLGNREWLMTAACSAGPAFEGGGIRWGMRAEEGAIEKVVIDPETWEPEWSTVDDMPPRGICGSGMIDLIAELCRTGIVDPSGVFQSEWEHPRIREVQGEPGYVLALAEETPVEQEIVFTASDLKNLMYSKGAVYAGFTTLLGEAGLTFDDVERIIITGGFGQYLNIDKAVRIGLLPDLDRERFTYMGNSSIAGAYLALLSGDHRREAGVICRNMTYIDLSNNNRYMDEFTSALFLPHTDMASFPSVVEQKAS